MHPEIWKELSLQYLPQNGHQQVNLCSLEIQMEQWVNAEVPYRNIWENIA